MSTVIFANWASRFGLQVEVTVSENGRRMSQPYKLGKPAKRLTKDGAKRLLAALKDGGGDIDSPVLTGKNAQNRLTVRQLVTRLAEASEAKQEAGLTAADFSLATGLTGCSPSKNKLYNQVMRRLFEAGCFVESRRGAVAEEIDAANVDLDQIEL